jgi:hypothetical protein
MTSTNPNTVRSGTTAFLWPHIFPIREDIPVAIPAPEILKSEISNWDGLFSEQS